MASRFLSAEKRRAAFAIYAYCRVADDIVDEAPGESEKHARAALSTHRVRLAEALRGSPRGPIFRELRWAVRRFGIPGRPFHELINTLHGDLHPGELDTWEDLERYCDGVASTVGEMCAHIFGLPPRGPARRLAIQRARTLGVALQLTNIMRDIGEDAERGRCYLPTADLARFGLSRDDVLARAIDPADSRWTALMRFEIARARALYADGSLGLDLVDADARCCATVCARGYAAILDALERRAYDSLSGRARVGTTAKARIMLSVWHETRRFSRVALAAAPRISRAPLTISAPPGDRYQEPLEA
ncbi:MAG: phytoene/squalene synthase family protein [Gemmatimonadota bacterium]|nr:phytoene/squalene synthase family protein [Gemmatimonadota bacterium]